MKKSNLGKRKPWRQLLERWRLLLPLLFFSTFKHPYSLKLTMSSILAFTPLEEEEGFFHSRSGYLRNSVLKQTQIEMFNIFFFVVKKEGPESASGASSRSGSPSMQVKSRIKRRKWEYFFSSKGFFHVSVYVGHYFIHPCTHTCLYYNIFFPIPF